MGGCPHIVLCRLDLDKVACSNPLLAATKGLRGLAIHRARAAWQNYHAMIEVAKKRMTGVADGIDGNGKQKPAKRGGCGLFVELHAMASDAAASDGPIQLGYGLKPYEVRSLVTGRQPAGSTYSGHYIVLCHPNPSICPCLRVRL